MRACETVLCGRVCFTGLGRPGQDCIPVRCLEAIFREWDNLTCTVKESHLRRIKLTRFPPGSVLSQTHRSILLSLAGVSRWYLSPKQVHQIVSTIEAALPRSIPILVDADHKSERLGDLPKLVDYVVCSTKFPQAWTEAPSIPSALVSMLLRLPNIKFAVVTLGQEGCIMLERSVKVPVAKLRANKFGTVHGRLIVGTAEKIPPLELLDTTGAGDAFIGAVLYVVAICTNMPVEKMLPFAAQVAAGCCRGFGARTGLPYHTDSRLTSFLS
ncbi:hypothetical protein FEM48_Zijuj12G0123400 [Ziziphus jujuba var. spinosa]|uniref:Carbohydrate kinase PfkB domain-containing protein n=1 Tax=Ziziphus jujuba var. spinosa TaxID=714518 RepID=A0A978UDA6_ZIZJJ|nr:hypothetical protein FEM48_Zijuj12G0123400 [Ziziphus jujuba var. spinosa]